MEKEKNINAVSEADTPVETISAEDVEVKEATYTNEETKNELVKETVDEMGVIARNTVVTGDIETKGHLAIAGKLVGNIRAKGNVIISGSVEGNVACDNLLLERGELSCEEVKATGHIEVRPESLIKSDISCKSMLISGAVIGKVDVEEQIAIAKTAKFEGDMVAGNLGIEFGAVISGSIKTR